MKVALFDVDGVVNIPEKKFSERFISEYNAPPEKVIEFFDKERASCTRGQTDLKEVLARYLPAWQWNGSVEELLEYWFSVENAVDERMVKTVQELRGQGIRCLVASDQEKYRAAYLWNDMKFKEYFDGNFFSCDIGHKKSEKKFFEKVIKKLKVNPDDVAFWDDSKEKVETAQSCGIHAHFYENFDTFQKQLEQELKA